MGILIRSLKKQPIDEKFKNIKIIEINDVDLSSVFLHYTSIYNINNIAEQGLEPRIGQNSKGIEKTKKIFFSIGDKGALIILDAWLRWLISRPNNKYIYRIGAYLIDKPYFPSFIFDITFKKWHKSEYKLKKACKKLKKILENSIYLVLNLEENKDFSFHDIDEVKMSKIPQKYLNLIYRYGQNTNNKKTEYWNMHTYSNRKISADKISLLKINDSYSANKILKYIASKNEKYIQDNCELLNYYLKYKY